MRTTLLLSACLVPLTVVVLFGQSAQTPSAGAAAAAATPAADPSPQRALINKYCVTCHNAKLLTGGLALDKLDLQHLGDHADIGEKMVRKLRAGMMPPSGMARPDAATMDDSRHGWKASSIAARPLICRLPAFIA